jgi:hypothetical protein
MWIISKNFAVNATPLRDSGVIDGGWSSENVAS